MSMNAQHLDFGIITYDREKAEKKLHEVVDEMVAGGDEVLKIIRSKTDVWATFKSGKCIKWINLTGSWRGYRLHGAYVDEALMDDKNAFDFAVLVPLNGYNENGFYWF